MPLEYFACGERQDRPELVLVQNSGQVDDDTPISTSGCILRDRMDERVVTHEMSVWIGIEKTMPEILGEVN